MTVSLRTVHAQVWALLDSIDGLTVYDGEVPKTPPSDDAGRVYAYAVLYVSAGRPHSLTQLATEDSLAGGFQVTCAGGYPERALWCLDRVRNALIGAEITVDGQARQIVSRDVDPGTVRRDDDVTPVRHYVPALFDVFIP